MLPTAIAVCLLAAVAVVVGGLVGLGQVRDVVWATARAAVQLAVVGLVIAAVFGSPGLAPLYLLVVWTAATWTCGRRLGGSAATMRAAAIAIGSGTATSAVVVLASGALPLSARTAVPFVAQLAGGSMTATTLAGQRLRDDVVGGWDVVEGWLSLGAAPGLAVRPMARTAAARALVPAIDQTRNVGLVVLPGSYVGLLLGGASPVEAGRVQLLVLVGLLASQTVAAVLVTRLLSTPLGTRRPGPG